MTALWDTTGTAVVKALAAERRRGGSVASGLALTLVVVVEESKVEQAERAATRAAAEHPCRLIVVVRRRPEGESRLDAEVTIGGRLGPGEAVVLRMYGRLSLHAESVVLPLLAPDAPVVTWWDGEPPRTIAHDPLGVFADRRVTDTALAPEPLAALVRRAEDYAPGDTDLAWTRATSWRALLASAFDSVTSPPRRARVVGAAGDPTRALLGGWLRARLAVEVEEVDAAGRGVEEAVVELAEGEVRISRAEGQTAVVRRTGQPDRVMPLEQRELGDLLAEELRRLDPDETYAEALEAATGVRELSSRSPRRTHEWHDPTEAPDPDPALTRS